MSAIVGSPIDISILEWDGVHRLRVEVCPTLVNGACTCDHIGNEQHISSPERDAVAGDAAKDVVALDSDGNKVAKSSDAAVRLVVPAKVVQMDRSKTDGFNHNHRSETPVIDGVPLEQWPALVAGIVERAEVWFNTKDDAAAFDPSKLIGLTAAKILEQAGA